MIRNGLALHTSIALTVFGIILAIVAVLMLVRVSRKLERPAARTTVSGKFVDVDGNTRYFKLSANAPKNETPEQRTARLVELKSRANAMPVTDGER